MAGSWTPSAVQASRTLSEGNLHGWVAGILPGDFGDLLIYGDGVAVSGTNFPPGQENINAVVVMTNASGVMQATDRRDGITVFFQRFEGTGELVVRTGLGDLVIEGVNTVGKIDESTPSGGGNLFGCLEWSHTFEHWKCNVGTHGAEGMAAID